MNNPHALDHWVWQDIEGLYPAGKGSWELMSAVKLPNRTVRPLRGGNSLALIRDMKTSSAESGFQEKSVLKTLSLQTMIVY